MHASSACSAELGTHKVNMEVLPTGALGLWHWTVFVTRHACAAHETWERPCENRYLKEQHCLRYRCLRDISSVPICVRLATAIVTSSLVGGIGTSSEWFVYRLTMRPDCTVLLVCQLRKFKKRRAKVHDQSVPCCEKGVPSIVITIRNKKQ